MFSVRPTPCQLVSPALLSADICWSLEMARSGISPASVRAWQGEYESTCFKDNRLTRGQHSHQGSDQLSSLVCNALLPEVLAVQSIKYKNGPHVCGGDGKNKISSSSHRIEPNLSPTLSINVSFSLTPET